MDRISASFPESLVSVTAGLVSLEGNLVMPKGEVT